MNAETVHSQNAQSNQTLTDSPKTTSEYHRAVLLEEVLRLLVPASGRLIIDGTLGGGGHSAALLAAGARVIGVDQDPSALDYATSHLSSNARNFQSIRGNFAEIGPLLDGLGIGQVDGVLLDLGVSSHQLDTPERGFSFMRDGPLDMRMDPNNPLSAADLVNTMAEESLRNLFRDLGEEPAARRIASRIVQDRLHKPFSTTKELADAVESASPRRGPTHPATRVFQALRIAVNRELDVLLEGLTTFSNRLAPLGRFAVITFHSLEDRIVKTFFKERSTPFLDRPEWPAPRANPLHIFQAITKKPLIASPSEQKSNPRSRSAKLRVVERIAYA